MTTSRSVDVGNVAKVKDPQEARSQAAHGALGSAASATASEKEAKSLREGSELTTGYASVGGGSGARVPLRHCEQKVERRCASLGQPSDAQRLPPPCAIQCCVPPWADLAHPSVWQRRPPPCAMHSGVPPCAAVVQPGFWHRLPPP